MDEIQMEKYFIMSLAHLLFPTLHEKKLLVSPGTKNQNNDEEKKSGQSGRNDVGNPN